MSRCVYVKCKLGTKTKMHVLLLVGASIYIYSFFLARARARQLQPNTHACAISLRLHSAHTQTHREASAREAVEAITTTRTTYDYLLYNADGEKEIARVHCTVCWFIDFYIFSNNYKYSANT